MKIEDLQRQLELGLAKLRAPEYKPLQATLKPLIPPGFHACVRLSGPTRKKNKNAPAENWSPESGDTILIHFEPNRDAQEETKIEQESTPLEVVSRATPPTRSASNPREDVPVLKSGGLNRLMSPSASNPCEDLVRALDRAESRPGFDFVALKWFRDTALVEEGFGWAKPEAARQSALRDAIANRLILTNRIENPRSPQFPVTTVRLNRLLPEVQTILRGSGQDREDFQPVAIRGEPLSTTILRDRR